MRQILCLIYSPFRLIIVLILSPILSVVYWILFIPSILQFHLFRNLLSIIARSLDPDLCKIVNAFGHITSRDYADWTTKPSQLITAVFRLKGRISLEEVRQLVLDKLILKTIDINHCELEYPELQQYYTKRLGFLFYKWDRSFDISNHVNVYSDRILLPNPETDIVDESKLMRIWESTLVRPLQEKRSAWEVLLIPNHLEPPKTKPRGESNEELADPHCLVILRIHHGLCDGISIYKLLLMLTDNGMSILKKDIIAFQKAPPCMDFVLNFKAFLFGPTAAINRLSKGIDFYNPIHHPLGKLTGKYHMVKKSFDLETIKNIARVHLDVSFHSVLIAGLTGGIRNYLLANGHSVPFSPIRMGIPIPKLGHSIKLRNEYLVSIKDLPVEKKTPKQRLFACEKRLNSLKSESLMPYLVQTWRFIGGLPIQLLRFLTLKSAISVGFSEIKGPSIPLTILDGKFELLDLTYAFGLGTDDLGVVFTSISINGRIHIILNVDQGISKSLGKAEQMMNFVEKELEELQYGDSTNL